MRHHGHADPGLAWRGWLAALADPACGLTVTVFGTGRYAAWDMGRRTLDEHMVHCVRAGGHQGSVDGQRVATVPGDLLWVPPGVPQELRKTAGAAHMGLYYLRFTLPGARWPVAAPVQPRVGGAAALFAQLYAEHAARLSGRDERMRALLVLLFSEWWRAEAEPTSALGARERARLLELVDRDPAVRWHPARLARELGMSPTWFARRFRRTFGASPRSWLVIHRIQRAAERLQQDDLPIGAVAAEFGYDEPFLFSRQFSAVMGVSPRAWRGRLRQ